MIHLNWGDICGAFSVVGIITPSSLTPRSTRWETSDTFTSLKQGWESLELSLDEVVRMAKLAGWGLILVNERGECKACRRQPITEQTWQAESQLHSIF